MMPFPFDEKLSYILVLCSLVIPTETIPKQQIFARKFEGKFGKSEFSLGISEQIISECEFSLEIPERIIGQSEFLLEISERIVGQSEFSLEISERIVGQSEFSSENSRQIQQ